MHRTARLLLPALRWSRDTGFDHEAAGIDTALRIGVGGFTIFGGDAEAVARLTASLRERSGVPLLLASDLERGAGQQFPQATALPPLAAIGSLDDAAVTQHAGAITADEAMALGVNLLLAPVADVDLEPRNPIVGTRAFGSDSVHVARHVALWIEGARSAGALCCVKHFPGHGRTVEDSHAALPRVTAARAALEDDLRPFRAAIAAGVDAVMTAHVVYDALDGDRAATLSPRVLTDLLRGELDHDGLILSDALNMAGVLSAVQGSEPRAAIAAVNAGCDGLLYPSDPEGLAMELDEAIGAELDATRVGDAIRRIEAAAQRTPVRREGAWGSQRDRDRAADVADRALVVVRGEPRAPAVAALVEVDDDTGGPFPPPSRDAFAATLRAAGIDVRDGSGAVPIVAVYADVRAWKRTPLSARARSAVEDATRAHDDAIVVFFGHPRLAEGLPGRHILSAWGGEPIMQRAAARRLARAHTP